MQIEAGAVQIMFSLQMNCDDWATSIAEVLIRQDCISSKTFELLLSINVVCLSF